MASERESLPSPAGRWGRVREPVAPRDAGPLWDESLTRSEPEGVLDVTYALRGERTYAKHVFRAGSTRFSQALSSAGPDVAYNIVLQTGGGLVEGERYVSAFALPARAHAVVATQAPTCVFKCEHGRVSVQESRIEVGEGATFEFYQDPLIPYEHARLRQTTAIELAAGARCLVFDGVSGGWSPDGEPFRYGDLLLSTEVRRQGRIQLVDRLLLEPGEVALEGLGYFEGLTNLDSAILADEEVDEAFVEGAREAVGAYLASRGADEETTRFGISAMEGGGCVLRILGTSAAANREAALAFSEHWRSVRGFHPLRLRRNDTRHH